MARLLVLLAFVWMAAAVRADAPFRVIYEDPVPAADRAALEGELARGLAAWTAHVGPVARPPVVRVGGGAMRAGYSAEKDEIGFPPSGAVVAWGIRSSDIVLHELFHALCSQFAQARAAAEGDDDQRALHEALADLFAHTLNPDAQFGEGYYVDRPCVRTYHSDFCYELAQGPHARGNALVSRLIDAGYTLEDVGRFLRERPFTRAALLAMRAAGTPCLGEGAPGVDVTPRGYPASMLQKFVLEVGRPLDLAFVPDAAFLRELGPLAVAWDAGETAGLTVTPGADEGAARVWRFEGRAGAKPRKAVARFVAGGRVVGFMPFYFRVR